MQLPSDIAQAVQPVFDLLPLDAAMPALVVNASSEKHPADHAALCDAIEAAIASPALGGRDALASGLWLYADELDRSHTISQSIQTPTGSFWHGIMHRREGDFGNSKYWFRNTGDHPAMPDIPASSGGSYDPYAFVDDAEAAYRDGDNTNDALVQRQRDEWAALFAWCAAQ